MNIQETIDFLEEYNAWRRGAEMEQPDPTKLGIVLDELISFNRKIISLETQNSEANFELLKEFSCFLRKECEFPEIYPETIKEFLNK